MNLLDIFIAAFLLGGLIKGFRNGFFVELASLVSILLGIFIAIKFSYVMKSYLQNEAWNPKTIEVSAFALTFLLAIICVSLLAKVFTSIANFASLGFLNNFLGAVLGLIRTILMMSILLNLFQKINTNNTFLSKETKEKSILLIPIQEISKTIYPSISNWFEAFQSNGFEFEDSGENE